MIKEQQNFSTSKGSSFLIIFLTQKVSLQLGKPYLRQIRVTQLFLLHITASGRGICQDFVKADSNLYNYTWKKNLLNCLSFFCFSVR